MRHSVFYPDERSGGAGKQIGIAVTVIIIGRHGTDLHIADTTTLIREFECPTPWATFRIDLVAQTPTHRIGFE